MREQKTPALARTPQAHTKESECPTGVLCEAAWELQLCMAALLVLNSNEIVEPLLQKAVEGECGTPLTPEEEAALLGNIKPDIEVPQVPEWLEIHEQVQSAEQTAAPTAPFISLPSPPSPLPSPRAKKPKERAARVDAISVTQWVWSYLEENYRVPEWWREFWPLLQSPCDSATQKLVHQQAMAFQIPTKQVEKDGWWITSPCLDVLGWRK